MMKKLGTLKCIDIVRTEYFKQLQTYLRNKTNLLIVGGGYGSSLTEYLELDIPITFTDIDYNAVKHVEDIYNKYDRIDFSVCSSYQLPFKDDSYDVIVSTLNGSYLNEASLLEFHRVLRKDGILVISETTPEYINYLKSINRYDGNYILASDMKSKIFHPYVYTEEQLNIITNKCGFSCLSYEILKPLKLIEEKLISNTIIGMAKQLNISYTEVPLLYYMILRGEKND